MNNKKKKHKGFTIPENYFEKMQNEVKSQISFPSHLDGMKVPDEYFQEMQNAVLNKIEIKSTRTLIPLWSKAIAACFILGLSAYTLFTIVPTTSSEDSFARFEEFDDSYLLNDVVEDLTIDQLALLLSDDELLEIQEESDIQLLLDEVDISDLEDML